MAKKRKEKEKEENGIILIMLLLFLVFFYVLKWITKKPAEVPTIAEVTPAPVMLAAVGGGGSGPVDTTVHDFSSVDFDSADFDTGVNVSA